MTADLVSGARTAHATLSEVADSALCADPGVSLPGFALTAAGVFDAAWLAPAFADAAASGGTAYFFRVTGFAVPSLPRAERMQLLTAPTDRIVWARNTGRYLLVVVVPPETPIGSYPVRLALPDGRAAAATPDVPAAASAPLTLESLGRSAPGIVGGVPSTAAVYLFRVQGLDIAAYEAAVDADGFRASVTRPAAAPAYSSAGPFSRMNILPSSFRQRCRPGRIR